MPTDPTADLEAEQHHLTESRGQLRRMRDRTAAMDASAGGDWVSREYLASTFALRMKQLADDPTVPLFFGRLDYADGRGDGSFTSAAATSATRRRADGHRLAGPVSLPFYRATRTDPMGVGCGAGSASSTAR